MYINGYFWNPTIINISREMQNFDDKSYIAFFTFSSFPSCDEILIFLTQNTIHLYFSFQFLNKFMLRHTHIDICIEQTLLFCFQKSISQLCYELDQQQHHKNIMNIVITIPETIIYC